MAKIRIAVIGAGEFGQHHARVLHELPEAELVAVVDTDAARAREVGGRFGAEAIGDYRELVGRVDAATLAVPTALHVPVGVELLSRGLDLLVEKPIAPDLASADRLLQAARDHGRILQAGHLERFNPAVEAAAAVARLPLFFEVHRMSVFTPRSLDIDVVLDLMIHDIDIVLSLVESPLQQVQAVGLPVLSPRADIAHVRLQFENGCVANLTASRVSTERVRKLRLFQPQEYISLDYGKQHAVRFRVGADRQISFAELPAAKGEPLALQFEAFLSSVETRSEPKLNGGVARRTLEVALAILDKMREHSEVVAQSLVTGWTP